MQAKERLIVALDVDSTAKVERLLESLNGHIGCFKVGLQLFHSLGMEALEMLRLAGAEVFGDFKFHDIPNTVAGAARAVTRQQVKMFNIHAGGGQEMMRAAAEASRDEAARLGITPPLVLAVTVLTSISEKIWTEELGMRKSLRDTVRSFALHAKEAGLDGVIASPQELSLIRETCGKDFVVVTPGIRPRGSELYDQQRVTTPSEAIQAGATYIVVGRPVTGATDPRAAAEAIVREMEGVSC